MRTITFSRLLIIASIACAVIVGARTTFGADNYGDLRNSRGRDTVRTICTYRPGKCNNSSCEKILVCVTPTGTLSTTPPETAPTETKKGPACKQSISDIQFSGACDNKNFKYEKVSYACADGTSGTLGDGTSCNTVSKWISEVRKECRTHASCDAKPPTISGTPSPMPCLKHMGDANCDGTVDMVDFEIWRQEFKGEKVGLDADFNSDKSVDIVDFEIWREGAYPEDLPPLPTATETPVASPSITPSGQPPITCGWCGNTCAPFDENKLCPMVMPEEAKTCRAVEKEGKIVCSDIPVTPSVTAIPTATAVPTATPTVAVEVTNVQFTR